MAATGDTAVVACQPGSVLERRARACGTRTLPLLMRSGGDLPAVRTLRGFIARHGVPLVHAHDLRAQSLMALATFDGLATRVATRRGHGQPRRSLGGLRDRLGVDHWVALSPRVAASLGGGGNHNGSSSVSVIPAGVAVEAMPAHGSLERNALLPALGLAGHEGPLVGVAVDLGHHRGLDALIDAAAMLRERWPELRVVIAGDGEQRQFLQARVARLGLSSTVRLPGWIDEVDRLLALLDVYAAPAVSGGYHGSLLRALGAGCPVVTSDVGDAADLVDHERSGLLVPPGDSDAFGQAIARLLEHREWAAGLGRVGCRAVRERYSVGVMVHGHRRLYARLVDDRSRRAP